MAAPSIVLSPGFQIVAHKIQEAAMQHSDVKARLKDVINDHKNASGGKHSDDEYLDHDGDGSEGNCTYICKGDIRQAPYEIGQRGGKSVANIDMDNSKNVVPVTSYLPEGDDTDHYTSMESARLYTDLPIYERFISKKTRDNADSGSFAGKGKSFPILKPEDVSAALHSIGRAGPGNYSGDTIRANIKRIAKAKGFALPDSLKDDKESWKPEGVELRESAHFQELPRISESATSYPIKLISPGRGSSGYYPDAVLKKAADDRVFKAGTQMFWNHDTDAEEAARPEGDLNRLAAVTTTDAKWDPNGKDGPGLYANASVFPHYAEKVASMGKHIGLSIRAGGDRDEAAMGPDKKPRVITALRNAASVDFVTKAGRDGKIFTESATHNQEGDMDKNEVTALIRESLAPLQTENKQLKEMLAATRAPALIAKHLDGIRFPAQAEVAIKGKITEALALSIPLDAAGNVDDAKLKTMVEAKAKEWADLLPSLGYTGTASMGTRMDDKELNSLAESLDKDRDQVFEGLAELFVGPKLTKGSVGEDKRQLRKEARKVFSEGRAA
jgi:hypothetical protein